MHIKFRYTRTCHSKLYKFRYMHAIINGTRNITAIIEDGALHRGGGDDLYRNGIMISRQCQEIIQYHIQDNYNLLLIDEWWMKICGHGTAFSAHTIHIYVILVLVLIQVHLIIRFPLSAVLSLRKTHLKKNKFCK